MSDQQLQFVLQYEPLVYKVIQKYQGYGDFEDLHQAGMLGLLKAVEHLDEERLESFSSYAKFYIQGEVNQFLRENKAIKLSKEVISLTRQYDLAKERLAQQFGRCPSREEIAFVLEIEPQKVQEIEQAKIQTLSLDYQREDMDLSYYNFIKQEEVAYQAEFQDLHQAIENLPSPDKEIILAQFFEEKTQMEIAQELGISQVQVSRKKERGLQYIKQKVA